MFQDPVDVAPRASQHVAAFRTLEAWSLTEIFQRRACVMRSVPFIMKAAYRGAMRGALQEVMRGRELNCGSWVVPSSSQVTLVSFSERGARPQEAVRLRLFHSGQWSELRASSVSCEVDAHQISSQRRRRVQRDEEERRADRARSLVQMGELSAARGALEALPVAPGTMSKLAKLTDPERRPPLPREELCEEVVNSVPERSFELDPVEFLMSVRTARRGAAAGTFRNDGKTICPPFSTTRPTRCSWQHVLFWQQGCAHGDH